MKAIIDFIPLIIFFVLYKLYDIYLATGAIMVATIVQVTLLYTLYKKVEKMQLVTLVMVLVFGSMTLIFHDDSFIKWKVTIIYTLFALSLIIAQLMNKPLIQGILGKDLPLNNQVWNKISWAWALFFLGCAATNIYVAFYQPLDVWVNFKVFGLLAATLLFTLLTGMYIYKQLNSAKTPPL